MYFYLFLNVMYLVIEVLDPKYFSAPSLADSVFSFASSLLLIVLTGLAIFTLHKRKRIAALLVVLTIFLSYGFSSFPLGTYVDASSSPASFIFASLFLVIDTAAIAYVIFSKEIRLKFDKS